MSFNYNASQRQEQDYSVAPNIYAKYQFLLVIPNCYAPLRLYVQSDI
jgi:hypothetical protein